MAGNIKKDLTINAYSYEPFAEEMLAAISLINIPIIIGLSMQQ